MGRGKEIKRRSLCPLILSTHQSARGSGERNKRSGGKQKKGKSSKAKALLVFLLDSHTVLLSTRPLPYHRVLCFAHRNPKPIQHPNARKKTQRERHSPEGKRRKGKTKRKCDGDSEGKFSRMMAAALTWRHRSKTSTGIRELLLDFLRRTEKVGGKWKRSNHHVERFLARRSAGAGVDPTDRSHLIRREGHRRRLLCARNQ